jgi:hypothetical protein
MKTITLLFIVLKKPHHLIIPVRDVSLYNIATQNALLMTHAKQLLNAERIHDVDENNAMQQ